MQEIDVLKRAVGVSFTDDGVANISVWSPLAQTIEIDIRGKRLPLSQGAAGYWKLTTTELKTGDQYRFSVDGKDPLPDPASLAQPDGVHCASQAVDLNAYTWQTADWNNLPLQDYIIYELHVGTFTEAGDFASIEARLDHLKELGITAIELMPLAQFPGKRNWGYDGVYPFAVQASYGGAEGLQRLVDACHQKGIAVILDVVYNHLGPEGNYLPSYGPYFTDRYKTPWGSAINFDDCWCDGVRDYYIENALMWFRDFKIDALRLDAVHAIKDFSPIHILREIKARVNELMEKTGQTHHLIVELDLNDTRFIEPFATGGYAADVQWIDEFHHALRVTAGGETTGYYSDFNGIEHLAKAYRDGYVYDGQWSPHRKKRFGVKADAFDGSHFIAFSQNHDQVGNRMLGERSSCLFSFEMRKLMAASVFISPFLPMLFMGEEWTEPAPFLYFVDHSDKELCAAVSKGRKAEFAAFHAEGEAPDPTIVESFGQSKLQWNLLPQGKHQIMFTFYKQLIRLRKQVTALRSVNRDNLIVQCNAEEKTLFLHRWEGEQNMYCFLNFSAEEKGVVFEDAASLQVVLDSADTIWSGFGRSSIQANKIQLKPESILILSETQVDED